MPAGPSGVVVLTVIYVLIAVSAIIIGARIYLRLAIQKQRLVTADWLRISAWCTAFVTGFFDILYAKEGVLHPGINYTLSNWDAPLEQQIRMRKYNWVNPFPFYTTFYLCKASLLVIYLQLFPPFMVMRRLMVWIVVVYCACAYIVTISLQLFLCYPIERNWYYRTIISDVHVSNMLSSLLPPVLHHPQSQHAKEGQKLWCSLDVYIGLVICCIPALRPYLHRKGVNYNIQESGRPSKSGHAIRRTGQSGFEEIIEGSGLGGDGRNDSWSGSHSCGITAQLSDKKDNGSDIELVSIELRLMVKKASSGQPSFPTEHRRWSQPFDEIMNSVDPGDVPVPAAMSG
ncbi:integral membrane protein [Fusarium circinatum]|uniref:Integral membrane protein n=1 Tax=Fusarium circinatum TaxID=48490 RepID=A0A8H5UE97_FUSCI|nr:integral membrane protein [Fusarium circinatum]